MKKSNKKKYENLSMGYNKSPNTTFRLFIIPKYSTKKRKQITKIKRTLKKENWFYDPTKSYFLPFKSIFSFHLFFLYSFESIVLNTHIQHILYKNLQPFSNFTHFLFLSFSLYTHFHFHLFSLNTR